MRSVFLARPDAAELRHRIAGLAWISVWLPPALACLLIAGESGRTMAAAHTNSWLRPVFERVFGPLRDTTWWWIHHLIRKGGHFAGYALVCLTFLRAWLLTLARRPAPSDGPWRLPACGLAVASTFVVACCDEWHQTFVPGRTGMFSDVLLDTGGALAMCGVAAMLWRPWRT